MLNVHVFGTDYPLTAGASKLVPGKVERDALYRFMGTQYLRGTHKEHLTKSGQVGVGAVRQAIAWAKDNPKPAKGRRKTASMAVPKISPPKEVSKAPSFRKKFWPASGGAIFNATFRVAEKGDPAPLGTLFAFSKEGSEVYRPDVISKTPPAGKPVKVQKFMKPWGVDELGVSHFRVRFIEVVAEAPMEKEVKAVAKTAEPKKKAVQPIRKGGKKRTAKKQQPGVLIAKSLPELGRLLLETSAN